MGKVHKVVYLVLPYFRKRDGKAFHKINGSRVERIAIGLRYQFYHIDLANQTLIVSSVTAKAAERTMQTTEISYANILSYGEKQSQTRAVSNNVSLKFCFENHCHT